MSHKYLIILMLEKNIINHHTNYNIIYIQILYILYTHDNEYLQS